MSTQTPEGTPRIVAGVKDYDCKSGCGKPIVRGEPHVTVHDYAPQKDSTGRVRSNLRAHHFQVRYHIKCFERTRGGADQRTMMLSYDIRELDGYQKHAEAVERMLRDGS